MKRKETRNKIINYIMINGEKKTSENILLTTVKKLQKNSKKQLKQIIQLTLINSTPTFKLHKIENKKRKKRNRKVIEIPAFISNSFTRTSVAIKFILTSAEKKKSKKFYDNFNQEIILAAQSKGNSIDLKNTLQKHIILKKHLFKYYRWK
jgi:small subunit ribosomal protein S7